MVPVTRDSYSCTFPLPALELHGSTLDHLLCQECPLPEKGFHFPVDGQQVFEPTEETLNINYGTH